MNCATAQRWLLLKSDGPLGWPREQWLARHQLRCPACARFAGEWAELDGRLADSATAPEQIKQRILESAGTMSFKPAWWRMDSPVLARVAAGLLVAFGLSGAMFMCRPSNLGPAGISLASDEELHAGLQNLAMQMARADTPYGEEIQTLNEEEMAEQLLQLEEMQK